MKILIFLLLAVLAFRLFVGRWPWQPGPARGGIAARAQARALLGVPPGARREEIIDAHRRLLAQVHPDRGGTSELVHEANAARDLLLAELVRASAVRR